MIVSLNCIVLMVLICPQPLCNFIEKLCEAGRLWRGVLCRVQSELPSCLALRIGRHSMAGKALQFCLLGVHIRNSGPRLRGWTLGLNPMKSAGFKP